MPYLTGGFAWGHSHVKINDADGDGLRAGPVPDRLDGGGGAEFALSGNWTAKVEYEYVDLTRKTLGLADFGMPGVAIEPRLHLLKFGLNYQLGDAPWSAAPTRTALPESDDWSVHAQTTLIPQTYPSFRAPYTGTNSLPGPGQAQMTWTTTAFLGVRLWEGGEFYFNPETAQGFGLNGTLGLAGFSNGEAQKAGAPYPKIRPQRYYFKQTFGLGGEQEEVADGPNQIAGKRDIDRAHAHRRPLRGRRFLRRQFLRQGPARRLHELGDVGVRRLRLPGRPARLHPRRRASSSTARTGRCAPACSRCRMRRTATCLACKTGGAVVEFEGRYAVFDQPGKFGVGVFGNRGNTGNYSQALGDRGRQSRRSTSTTVIAGIRKDNLKYGFYLNGEQQIAQDVGLFGRLSWNDGQNEILSFTDVDRSVSGGLSIEGSRWGRPNDTIGIGGAVNGLSAAHRDFLAAGGLGLLIGDGALNYSPERIFETYYAYQVSKNLDADRGLSVHHQPRLQRRPRPGAHLLRPRAREF